MKTRFLILSFFLFPFIVFSQQSEKKDNIQKKETYNTDVKKLVLTQDQQMGATQMIKPSSENERMLLGIPDDFPRCLNTGNKRQDEDIYYKAQEVWIKNNPERFKKIKNTSL